MENDPLLTFIFSDDSTRAPVSFPLSDIFHFREELIIMQQMLQCENYHGNVADVLTGFHGLNMDPTIRSKFHTMFSFSERKQMLQEFLPAFDHCTNIIDIPLEMLNLFKEYKAWRLQHLATRFHCANALYKQLFCYKSRIIVLLNARSILKTFVKSGKKSDRMFKMLVLLSMAYSDDDNLKEVSEHISTRSRTIALNNCPWFPFHDFCYEMFERCQTFARMHEIRRESTDHSHEENGLRKCKIIYKEWMPAKPRYARLIVKFCFKYFVTAALVAEIVPRSSGNIPEFLTRNV
jgi:hypothetical protein